MQTQDQINTWRRGVTPQSHIPYLPTYLPTYSIIIPSCVAWSKPEVPLHTFLLLFWATVTFLKLVSFAHTNWDLRQVGR